MTKNPSEVELLALIDCIGLVETFEEFCGLLPARNWERQQFPKAFPVSKRRGVVTAKQLRARMIG